MHNKLVIVGCGGHGKVIADIAIKNGYQDISFVDDNEKGECIGFPIIGTTEILNSLNDGKTDFVIAVGNNVIRKSISKQYSVNWVTLIHPSAQIGLNTVIGKGTVVMAGAVINACAFIGEHCIINTCAIVEHDNYLNDYVHISPNATLGGTVTVGETTHIGLGALIKNNIEICGGCTIGIGSVVINDIKEKGTYVGVPSRKIK
jgi:sugar O-acyltransferase (sialic acid O-acetyltransferase NeuD family)